MARERNYAKESELEAIGVVQEPLALPDVDPARLRAVAGMFATGVTIITTASEIGPLGFAANAFTSLSLEPPLVLVCLDHSSNTYPHLLRARAFAINVLPEGEESEAICRIFAGKSETKFAGQRYRAGETGAPLLEHALAYMECELDRTYEGGDHTIFIGRVVAAEAREGEPLVFYRGHFRRLTREEDRGGA